MSFPVPAAALLTTLRGDARGLAAEPRCPVVVESENVAPPWQDAVQDLQARLNEPGLGDVDCGRIEIRADGSRTSIVFTTRDGRRAERFVQAPGDLLAVAEGLQVTIPEQPMQAPTEQTVMPTAFPPTPPRAPDALPRPSPRESTTREVAAAHILVGGSGGVRYVPPTPCPQTSGSTAAAQCSFGFASLRVGVGVGLGRWELGMRVQYDPAEVPLGGSPQPGLTMSSYALALRVGRREPVGRVTAVAGVTTSIAFTDQSNPANQDGMQVGSQTQESRQLIEPRVGLFAGLVLPRRASVRVRPELEVDAHARAFGPAAASLPTLPWWSGSASVGIEWEAP